MKGKLLNWLKKNKVRLTFIGLMVIFFIIMAVTCPEKKDYKKAIPNDFKKLEARLTKKPVYLDYGIISGYYQTKKISAMLSESVEFVGVLGKVYKIKEGSVGEFIFDCMKWIPSLMQGAKITIALTVVTTIVGMILGLFLALGKMSKIPGINHFCKAYIFFFRGTPLLMQLMFIYYSLPMINSNLSIENRFLASAVAFGLNSGAYCAELIRAAIESIDKGQYEAAKALGFSYSQTMKKIIIPQTYKRLVPPFANEFIMILKDASLTSIIALQDLSKVTTAIQSSSSKYTVFIPSMIIYLLITWVFGKVFECLEKKYSVYE